MKKLLILLLFLAAGCGAIDPLRGHNIRMARDAVHTARKPLERAYEQNKSEAETEEELEEVEQEHLAATAALDDADRRLKVAQRDFPPPKVAKGEEPITRSIPEKPNEEDEYLFNAYAGMVYEREKRRAFWLKMRKPFEQLRSVWDTAIWAVTATIYILIVVVVVVVARKLHGVYLFLMRLLAEVVPDKEKRRAIAGGTPVEAAYHKEKRKNGKSKLTSG